MSLKLGLRSFRDELMRRWEGKAPLEALGLIPALFDLLDERDAEICRLRRERDFLVEAYADEGFRKGHQGI
tara:strand:- start:98 stop:310 length:213 start_codon:yes stop_codon:yes gene_type:complete